MYSFTEVVMAVYEERMAMAVEGGQQNQKQADPVHADVVLDAVARDPRLLLHELHPRNIELEAPIELEGHQKRQDRDGEGQVLDGRLTLPVHEEQERHPQEGQEDDRRDPGKIIHDAPPTIAARLLPSACCRLLPAYRQNARYPRMATTPTRKLNT